MNWSLRGVSVARSEKIIINFFHIFILGLNIEGWFFKLCTSYLVNSQIWLIFLWLIAIFSTIFHLDNWHLRANKKTPEKETCFRRMWVKRGWGEDSQEENPIHPYLLTIEKKSIHFVMKCVKTRERKVTSAIWIRNFGLCNETSGKLKWEILSHF